MDDEARSVSPAMWTALTVVVTRADGKQATYVTKSPRGPSEIKRPTAAALFQRKFINLTGGGKDSPPVAWPTEAGRAALASHLRMIQRRQEQQHG